MSNKQQALWQQGQRHTERQQWRQAADAYEAILQHDRNFLPAWLELSTAKEKLGAYRDSYRAVVEAARNVDVHPMAGLAIVRRLRKFEDLPRLKQYVERSNLAAKLPPEKLIDLAAFFSSAGQHHQTMVWIEHVIKLRPELPEAHNMHGLTLMFAGRSEESAEAFERALRIRPHYASIYPVLSRVAKIDAGHNHIDALLKLLSKPGLTTKDEANYCYALHNEFHELGDYEKSWHFLHRACQARKILQPYDANQTKAMFSALKRVFDRDFTSATDIERIQKDRPTPIFIVGLHRSGTTLLERILSGHADVADAGETYSFSAQLRYAANRFCDGIADGTILDLAAGFDYSAIGHGFLESMRARSQGKDFITEKMNPNFILLGPIAKSLPGAKLLHMRRAPADTCFSNLRTLFTREASYSYDQIEMADYYNDYSILMQHWRDIMPDRVFDIDYAAVVQDPATQSQRIAAHCGLDFRDDMLRVERRTGMVATASSNQVRQGILKNRGGIWKNYERHLGPMLDRLAAHGLA